MAWPSEVNGGKKTTSLLGNLLCVWCFIARMLARFLLGVAFLFLLPLFGGFLTVVYDMWLGSFELFAWALLVPVWWRILP